MIKKINRLIQKKKYAIYAEVVLSISAHNFQFEDICQILDLPYTSLQAFVDSLTKIKFNHLSSKDQLEFYIGFSAFEKDTIKHLYKKLVYPIFLLLAGFVLSFYFSSFFAPSILELLQDFDIQKFELSLLFWFVTLLKYAYFILFLILFILLVLLTQKDWPFVIYIRFHHKKWMALVRNILTIRFTYVYLYLLKKGLNTQNILKEMKDITGIPDVSWLAFHIEKGLSSGKTLHESFDSSFLSPLYLVYLNHGYYTESMIESLEKVLTILQGLVLTQFNKYIFILKTLSYTLILIMVSIFYIYLFQPLSIMEAIL